MMASSFISPVQASSVYGTYLCDDNRCCTCRMPSKVINCFEHHAYSAALKPRNTCHALIEYMYL